MERVVIEAGPDEEAIRSGLGRYVTTLTRSEFVNLVGFDVRPGEVVKIVVLRARRLEAAS